METKERILKGAEELFFKYGIKSITMDDIAKHLAISKKTIYQFYGDKNDMVETLMKEKLKQDECDLSQIQKESENVIVEVFNIMKHMSAMFASLNPNVFYDLQKYHSKAWALFKDFKNECMFKMVANSIDKGKKQGLVRADINTSIITKMRLEQIENAFNPQAFPPDNYKIVDVQITMLDHFLHGICTLKGHKLLNKYKEIIEEE
jgi:AcrR family transcriptional regulator